MSDASCLQSRWRKNGVLCSTTTQIMNVQQARQNLPNLMYMVFGALNPQLRPPFVLRAYRHRRRRRLCRRLGQHDA